jgi:hypothetical protein
MRFHEALEIITVQEQELLPGLAIKSIIECIIEGGVQPEESFRKTEMTLCRIVQFSRPIRKGPVLQEGSNRERCHMCKNWNFD